MSTASIPHDRPDVPADRPHEKRADTSTRDFYLLLAAIAICALLFIFPAPYGMSVNGWHAFALLIPIVFVWATETIPVGIGALLFLSLIVSFRITTPVVAFSGFLSQTPWLVAGALAISVAMEQSGLSKRMAYWIMSHLKGLWGLVLGAFVGNIVLMACASPAGRAGALSPVLAGVLRSIGNPKESNLSRFLAFNYCNATNAFLSNLTLTGSASNILLIAYFATLTRHSLDWNQWLIIMTLPTLILCAFGVLGSYIFSKPEPELAAKLRDTQAAKEAYEALGPMTAAEWKVLGLFLLAILLWVLGGVLKLDNGWAAIDVMGLLFAPKIGVLSLKSIGQINWNIMFLVGAAVGVGTIFDQTGMLKAVSANVMGPVLSPFTYFGFAGIAFACILVGVALHFILPSPSNSGVVFPLMVAWGVTTLHLPAAAVLAFLALMSAMTDRVILVHYQIPMYFVFLGQDITNNSKFNALLVKIFPLVVIGLLLAGFVAYAGIKLTGFGIS